MPKRKAEAVVAEEPGTSGQDDSPSNVVYVGHIPHGFYEKQMKDYFTQFGKVSKIRISRNKKTGKSKHYAFLEFQNPNVAKVVADAMDGYMFFGQKLTTRVMNRSEIHPELFKGANRVFKRVPWKKLELERHNKDVDDETATKRSTAATQRNKTRQNRLKEAGIEYDFPLEPGAAPAPPPKTATKTAAKPPKKKAAVVVTEKKKKSNRETAAPVAVKTAAPTTTTTTTTTPKEKTPVSRRTRSNAAATVTKKKADVDVNVEKKTEVKPKRKAASKTNEEAEEVVAAPVEVLKKRKTAAVDVDVEKKKKTEVKPKRKAASKTKEEEAEEVVAAPVEVLKKRKTTAAAAAAATPAPKTRSRAVKKKV